MDCKINFVDIIVQFPNAVSIAEKLEKSTIRSNLDTSTIIPLVEFVLPIFTNFKLLFSSVNYASNIWESVWLDRGDVFCAVSSMEIELSKMSIYITRGPVVNCWIRALVTGIYRLGYTSIGTTTSVTMQLTERQFVAGEYIIKDTYNYNTVTGNRACYCEFIR